jgi:hypothetical protein
VDDRSRGFRIGALHAGCRRDPTTAAGWSEAFAAAMRPSAKASSHTCAVRRFLFGVAARNLSQVV